MNIFKNFDWSAKSIAKVAAIGLAGILVLVIAVSLFAFAIRTIFVSDTVNYPGGYGGAEKTMLGESTALPSDIIPPTPDGGAVDENAREFEAKTYTVDYFTTTSKDSLCAEIVKLKEQKDIIFEQASEDDSSCNYAFKVLKESADEVLAMLQALDPDTLNVDIVTIQKIVAGMTDDLEIQKEKLAEVETTLKEAQKSYDELTQLAKNQQNVDALTKLIGLKIDSINRLAQERIDINAEINRITKAREEQLNRIKYTTFYVSIYEELYFDWKQIVDSWKTEIRMLVDNFNGVIQGVTIELMIFLVRAFQGIVYLFISLILLKGVWMAGKKIWSLGNK